MPLQMVVSCTWKCLANRISNELILTFLIEAKNRDFFPDFRFLALHSSAME